MKKFIITVFINAVLIFVLAHVLKGVEINGFLAALITALVLGLINAIIRPILLVLTLPLTVLTLGLFLLVINAGMVLLADKFVSGFDIAGFWWAVLFAILLSVLNSILHRMFGKSSHKK